MRVLGFQVLGLSFLDTLTVWPFYSAKKLYFNIIFFSNFNNQIHTVFKTL